MLGDRGKRGGEWEVGCGGKGRASGGETEGWEGRDGVRRRRRARDCKRCKKEYWDDRKEWVHNAPCIREDVISECCSIMASLQGRTSHKRINGNAILHSRLSVCVYVHVHVCAVCNRCVCACACGGEERGKRV